MEITCTRLQREETAKPESAGWRAGSWCVTNTKGIRSSLFLQGLKQGKTVTSPHTAVMLHRWRVTLKFMRRKFSMGRLAASIFKHSSGHSTQSSYHKTHTSVRGLLVANTKNQHIREMNNLKATTYCSVILKGAHKHCIKMEGL